MTRNLLSILVAVAMLAGASGCVADGRYGHQRRYGQDRYDDAWEVVRRDPCRSEQYRRYAADHENSVKRRQYIERLAREGCSLSDDRRSGRRDRDRDDAWEVVRADPCRYDEYRRYAAEHSNPEKRRAFVERLAREGCSRRERYDRYDREN